MEKDILVILMVAFGIFAVVMFVLFFVYLKKYYNSKNIEEDYQKELDQKIMEEQEETKDEPVVNIEATPIDTHVTEPVIEPVEIPVVDEPVMPNVETVDVPITENEPNIESTSEDSDMEFVPIKKK